MWPAKTAAAEARGAEVERLDLLHALPADAVPVERARALLGGELARRAGRAAERVGAVLGEAVLVGRERGAEVLLGVVDARLGDLVGVASLEEVLRREQARGDHRLGPDPLVLREELVDDEAR